MTINKTQWLYVSYNEDYVANLYKVGMSEISVLDRLDKTTRDTGVPSPFYLEKEYPVHNAQEAETLVFFLLHTYRHNCNKEFFKAPIEIIDKAIQTVLKLEQQAHSKQTTLKQMFFPREGEKITRKEGEAIIEAYRQGLSFLEIARKTQRVSVEIERFLNHVGLIQTTKTPNSTPHFFAFSRFELEPERAKKHQHVPVEREKSKNGKDLYQVQQMQLHEKAYGPWKKEDEEKLFALFHAGVSIDEMASILKRNRGGIESRLVKYHLIEDTRGFNQR